MTRPKNAISKWLKLATVDQTKALAKAADTSVRHLQHLAAERRGISPELAQRVAHASTTIKGLPKLDQRELCAVCAQCPLANKKAA
jgi:hypothetical protein